MAVSWNAEEKQACLEETLSCFMFGSSLMSYIRPPPVPKAGGCPVPHWALNTQHSALSSTLAQIRDEGHLTTCDTVQSSAILDCTVTCRSTSSASNWIELNYWEGCCSFIMIDMASKHCYRLNIWPVLLPSCLLLLFLPLLISFSFNHFSVTCLDLHFSIIFFKSNLHLKLFLCFTSVQDLTHHNHSSHNYFAITLSVGGTMSYGACREQHSWCNRCMRIQGQQTYHKLHFILMQCIPCMMLLE
jgi:hypothetical protein